MYADSEGIKHFRAACAAEDDETAYAEVRHLPAKVADAAPVNAEERAVDEVVTTGVHLEMTNTDCCWMNVNGLHVWFSVKWDAAGGEPRLVVTCSPSTREPVVVTRETSETGR